MYICENEYKMKKIYEYTYIWPRPDFNFQDQATKNLQ